MARPKRKQSAGSSQSAKKLARVVEKRSDADAKEPGEASPGRPSAELANDQKAEAMTRGKKRQRSEAATPTSETKAAAGQKLAADEAAEVADEVAEVDALWSTLRSEAAPPSDALPSAGLAGSESAYLSRQMEAFGQQLAALRDDEAFEAHSMPRLIEFLAAGRRALGGC